MAIPGSQTLRVMFLGTAIIAHRVLLAGTAMSGFAARSEHVARRGEDAIVFESNVPRHHSADDQGQHGEQLHKEDQDELDGEHAGDRVDGGRAVERVDDAVDGSDDGEG